MINSVQNSLSALNALGNKAKAPARPGALKEPGALEEVKPAQDEVVGSMLDTIG